MKTKDNFTIVDKVLMLFMIRILGTFIFNLIELGTRGIR
jgi:hypothetical protein